MAPSDLSSISSRSLTADKSITPSPPATTMAPPRSEARRFSP